MKICFVSIDVESDFAKGRDFAGVENIEKILAILKAYRIPATLFVTGTVLEKYQSQFKILSEQYEIAGHGFSHVFWNKLNKQERKSDLEKFISPYRDMFGKKPAGFRTPSHVIDQEGLKIIQENGFLYDSSVIPNYPPLKSYRGYKGKAIIKPYFPDIEDYKKQGSMDILEIPVSGLSLGIPLVGTWLSKLPFFIYKILLSVSNPEFLALSLHSWDSLNQKILDRLDKLLKILKANNYQFLNGIDIYARFSKNRK
jgi:peptidoglycan/xylan/chitin deacetylase (PgdA/CDA1 family)